MIALSNFKRGYVVKVMLTHLHKYVDKRARVREGDLSIQYSLYNYRTKEVTKSVWSFPDMFKTFIELYGE